MYYGIFDDKTSVEREFELPEGYLKDYTIIYAFYEYEDYAGDAFVVALDPNGNLIEVHGSHCSCYGLEDQWGEEKTSIDSLLYRLENENRSSYKRYEGLDILEHLLMKLKEIKNEI